ncbi:MAG: hypothetical protein P8099_12930 [Gemmatimonadota bacterium]
MRNKGKFLIAGALALLIGAAGCADLNVTNPNAPDASRALKTAGDVQSLISGAFNSWFDGEYSYSGPGLFLSNQSFQHVAPWANAGMVFYSWIPRPAVVNDVADQFYGNFSWPWTYNYRALSAVANGLSTMQDNPDIASTLGSESTQAVKAFAKFVQGMATASVAVLYDQGVVLDETTQLVDASGAPQPQTPVPYTTLMDTAMSYFNEALNLATAGPSFSIPSGWVSADADIDDTTFVKVIHSMKARYMAAVARTPSERQGLDWNAIISEINNGVTEDWVLDEDPHNGWYNAVVDYGTYPGWQMMPYYIAGMADQSGNYQTWLNTPLASKAAIINGQNIVIETPDLRFPQGTTVDSQEVNPGTKFRIPNPDTAADDWNIDQVWAHPERQQWRWSYYWASEYEPYTYWVDFHHAEIRASAQQLLKAEGEYYLGNLSQAADIINVTRTDAGLNATDASGTNSSCVPKLPDGSCGDLWEMLKWERRMNSRMTGLYDAPWYFDDRGWGDLFEGTQLEFPVPCQQLQLMDLLPCYTFGSPGGDGAAPKSTYQFPDEG